MALSLRARAKLTTVQGVGIEIAKIYRATKVGKIDTPDGYRLVQKLAVLKSCLESSALEQRIANLEAEANSGTVEHFRPRVVS